MAITTYEQMKPGLREISEHEYCLAADLGQQNDPTAICIMEHIKTFSASVKGHETLARETFDVRHLERLPLGLSYVQQVEYIDRLLRRPALAQGCDFLVDGTGVGLAVADLFDFASIKPIRVVITGGDRQTNHGPRNWHVPKGILISALDAKLHDGKLRFAAELRDAPAMRDELAHFRRHVSNAGRFSYEAKVGAADDLVLAVAIGLWNFVGRKKAPPALITKATFTNI